MQPGGVDVGVQCFSNLLFVSKRKIILFLVCGVCCVGSILQYGHMSMSSEASEGGQSVTKAYVEAGGDQGLLSLLTDETVFYVGGYPSSFNVSGTYHCHSILTPMCEGTVLNMFGSVLPFFSRLHNWLYQTLKAASSWTHSTKKCLVCTTLRISST